MKALRCMLPFVASLAVSVDAATARSGALAKGAPESAFWPVPPQPKGPSQPVEPIGPAAVNHNSSYNPNVIEPAKPLNSSQPKIQAAAACSGPITSNPSGFWMDQMDHTGNARGYAPYLGDFFTYKTWRNVASYGARGDGTGDQTDAIQNALNDDSRGGNRYKGPLSAQPAHVFIPSGTYQLGKKLDLRKGTIIMGDPQNPPVLKAAPGFSGSVLVDGYDSASAPETSFMIQLRNVIIDTNSLPPSQKIVALQWGVAQGCAIGNVKINMPSSSTGHTGMLLQAGSTIAVTDMQITGGAIGIQNNNQQVVFKNIYFKFCTTAYAATGGFNSVLQGVTFDTCGVGVDSTRNHGDVILLDSTSTNSGNTVVFRDSSNDGGDRNDQVVIQNLKHDTNNPIAVTSNNQVVLTARQAVDTWVWGNAVPGQYQKGVSYTTTRSSPLLDGSGKFFMKDAPTYGGYAKDQVVNVKDAGFDVKGDGRTDDSAALNAILRQNAANCKITYFPYGVYVVLDTLFIPPNSRIVGEAWAVITGAGNNFKDANNPRAVVKVGNPNDVGVAQISDMRFTVAEPLAGAKIMEWNMAGSAPGDVGFWNSIINIGGMRDSTVNNVCNNQDPCKAAHTGMHLTTTSSVYVQNLWVWTADHSEDGGPLQIISTGRGINVESTKATWLVGSGSEHHWLYGYNFNGARNVYAGLLQVESPYMQGRGAVQVAPAPWTATGGDPNFSWCNGGDGYCRTSVGLNVNNAQNVYLYSSSTWAFFDGTWNGDYSASNQCGPDCQQNMNRVAGSTSQLYWYGVNTKAGATMILDGQSNPKMLNNPGSWGGNLVAYRQFS